MLRRHEMIVARDPDAPSSKHAREIPNVSLLMFSLAGSTYAVEARHVSHVGPVKPPLPVPTAPSFVRGVIHERGRIITVIDLGAIVSGKPHRNEAPSDRLVVLELERIPIGVVAAKILGVSDVPISDIKALEPSAREEERAQLYRGRLESAKEMMLVLDGPGLLEALLDR